MAAEEILIALLGAGVQVGEREGRDVVGAAGEIERDGARARRPRPLSFAGTGAPVARAASSAAIEGTGSPSTVNTSGNAADHAVGIVVGVERADVAAEADRGALAGEGRTGLS